MGDGHGRRPAGRVGIQHVTETVTDKREEPEPERASSLQTRRRVPPPPASAGATATTLEAGARSDAILSALSASYLSRSLSRARLPACASSAAVTDASADPPGFPTPRSAEATTRERRR